MGRNNKPSNRQIDLKGYFEAIKSKKRCHFVFKKRNACSIKDRIGLIILSSQYDFVFNFLIVVKIHHQKFLAFRIYRVSLDNKVLVFLMIVENYLIVYLALSPQTISTRILFSLKNGLFSQS